MEWSLVIVAVTLLGVATISGRLSGTPVTPAMVFVAVGLLVGPEVLDGIDIESSSETVRTLAEATLALVLFCDASRIDLRQLRPEVGAPVRLLGIGLPLTIVLGAVVGAVILDQLTLEEAVILSVVLAPTDAALGQAVVTEPRIPGRIRQGLNVESGLNDELRSAPVRGGGGGRRGARRFQAAVAQGHCSSRRLATGSSAVWSGDWPLPRSSSTPVAEG